MELDESTDLKLQIKYSQCQCNFHPNYYMLHISNIIKQFDIKVLPYYFYLPHNQEKILPPPDFIRFYDFYFQSPVLKLSMFYFSISTLVKSTEQQLLTVSYKMNLSKVQLSSLGILDIYLLAKLTFKTYYSHLSHLYQQKDTGGKE